MLLLLTLFFSFSAKAGVLIYQQATASLSTTASLVTYTTPMAPLAQTQSVYYVNSGTYGTVAPNIQDNGYSNGIYTCKNQGTYSVGASLAITGTIALNSNLKLMIDVSPDGVTWTTLRSVTTTFPNGLTGGSAYVAFLVPCAANGQIRVQASTTVTLPVISGNPSDNALSISQIF